MKEKRKILAALLAFAAIAVFLFPRPLPCSAGGGLLVSVNRLGVEDGEPINEWTSANLPADSEGAAKVEAVLQKYRRRPTLQTIGDSIAAVWSSSGPAIHPGGGVLIIYFPDGDSASLTVAENGKALLNNRRWRIGFWGNAKGRALYEELLTAVEDRLK